MTNRTFNAVAAKSLRTARGVSLRDLSHTTGINRGHLSRIERGIHTPSARIIAAIATGLGVDVEAIAPEFKRDAA